jgi:hypothetical protein
MLRVPKLKIIQTLYLTFSLALQPCLQAGWFSVQASSFQYFGFSQIFGPDEHGQKYQTNPQTQKYCC